MQFVVFLCLNSPFCFSHSPNSFGKLDFIYYKKEEGNINLVDV